MYRPDPTFSILGLKTCTRGSVPTGCRFSAFHQRLPVFAGSPASLLLLLNNQNQVEHGVLSKVENANGVVTLLKELGRDNEPSVAVAATHCLRRIFTQLLDPAKNPQVHRGLPTASAAGA